MALIEIVKGNKKQLVSKDSFENFFKDNGWKVAGKIPASSDSQKAQNKLENEDAIKTTVSEENHEIEPSTDSNESSIDDEWDEVLQEESDEESEEVEKPISEMTRNELIKYANKNDISLAGLNKTNQFREAIREAMKEK